MLKKIHPYFKNKYSITILLFFSWILFFDQNNIVSQVKLKNKLNQLKEDQQYFIKEIKNVKLNLDELLTNPIKLEKFAREKYLMKKDNEEVFVLVEE